LLEAMKLLRQEDIFLSVVGEFWRGESEALKYISSNDLSYKIEIIAKYVSDEEAASYFTRCDLVILPYRSAIGSAVILLAYHYGKPVIATDVGGFPDVIEEGLTGTMVPPDSSTILAEAIKKVISGRRIYSEEGIASIKGRLTWDGLAKACLNSSV
jgi:glycosyltransferase involved in cell wall biosynthesis